MPRITSAQYMQVLELFEDESHWTQDAYARDAKGNTVQVEAPTATRWCLIGAIRKVCGFDPLPHDYSALSLVIWSQYPDCPSVPRFNDDKARSVEDIRRVVKLAAERAFLEEKKHD